MSFFFATVGVHAGNGGKAFNIFPLLARTRVIRAFVEMASNRSDRCKVYLAKILIDGRPPPLPVVAFCCSQKTLTETKIWTFYFERTHHRNFRSNNTSKKMSRAPCQRSKVVIVFYYELPALPVPTGWRKKRKKRNNKLVPCRLIVSFVRGGAVGTVVY